MSVVKLIWHGLFVVVLFFLVGCGMSILPMHLNADAIEANREDSLVSGIANLSRLESPENPLNPAIPGKRMKLASTADGLDHTNNGYIDGLYKNIGTGTYTLSGWACARNSNSSIYVDLYLDGPAGVGTMAARIFANLPSEPAVAAACQSAGSNYRFQLIVKDAQIAVNSGSLVYVHGINPITGVNSLIGNSGNIRVPDVNQYFNTNRAEKLMGASVLDPSQVRELSLFANTFGFIGGTGLDLSPIPQYLSQNRSLNRMLPMIGIRNILFSTDTGIVRADYQAVSAQIAQLVSRHYAGPVIFYLDEVFWNIRLKCQQGSQPACLEVSNHYQQTLIQLRKSGNILRSIIPGSGIYHVEAYAELILQKQSWGQVTFLDGAEYLGYDCYGDMANCGGHPQSDYLQWTAEALRTLESKKSLNRKIFLLAGGFQDLYTFRNEASAVQQINNFFSVLDSSTIYGGLGVFIWSNMEDRSRPTASFGARTIASVRTNIVNSIIARRSGGDRNAVTHLPPVLSLIASYQTGPASWISSLIDLQMPKVDRSAIYLQSAGMNSCMISMAGANTPMVPNKLQGIYTQTINSDTAVTATCIAAGVSYSKTLILRAAH